MRIAFIAGLAAVSCLSFAGQAPAGVKIETKTTTYAIVGKNGEELLAQMDRKGPKHGFLTRAIAQTRYTVNWDIAWLAENGGCRVDDAAARLNITYTFPRVASPMTPALRRKWDAFLRGVRKHEEMHGTIARRMVAAAEKSVSSVSFKNDPKCRAARAEVRRRVSAAYAKYETEQRVFDTREHRAGGKVSGLVDRLVQ